MKRLRDVAPLGVLLSCMSVSPVHAAGVADIWMHPLQTAFRFSQDFNEWNEDFSAFHLAEDYTTCTPGIEAVTLSACPEDEVHAAADGIVQHVGPHGLPKGYGWVVIIEHDLDSNDPAGPVVTSLYAHLRLEGLISEGTEVQQGDVIGRLSRDKNENGGYPYVHLHFGIRKGSFQDGNNPVSKCWFHAGYSSLFATGCFDEPNRIKNQNDPKHYDVKSDWSDPSDFIAKRRTSVHQEALGLYVGSFSSGNLYQLEIDTGISDLAATGLGQSLEDLVVDSLGFIYIGGRFTGVRRVDSVTGAQLSNIAANVVGPEGPSIDFYGDKAITQGDLFLNTRLGPGVHTGIWRVQIDSGAVTGENVVAPFSGWGEGTVFLTKGLFAGNLLAVDSTGGRVVRIAPPAIVGLYGPPQTFIGGLSSPIGIAVNSEGSVFVTEFGGRIRRFNSEGEAGSTFVDGLGLPFFIEFDADDNLYVVENVTGSVRKYSPGGALIWQSPLEVVNNPNNEGPIGIGINY